MDEIFIGIATASFFGSVAAVTIYYSTRQIKAARIAAFILGFLSVVFGAISLHRALVWKEPKPENRILIIGEEKKPILKYELYYMENGSLPIGVEKGFAINVANVGNAVAENIIFYVWWSGYDAIKYPYKNIGECDDLAALAGG